jgi:hypothetical protein
MTKRHYGETKAQRQAAWLADFNDAVITQMPSLSGRIEWPSALHFYYNGVSAQDAAARYVGRVLSELVQQDEESLVEEEAERRAQERFTLDGRHYG